MVGHSSQGFSGGYRGRTVKTTSADGVNGTFSLYSNQSAINQQSISNQSAINQQSISQQSAINQSTISQQSAINQSSHTGIRRIRVHYQVARCGKPNSHSKQVGIKGDKGHRVLSRQWATPTRQGTHQGITSRHAKGRTYTPLTLSQSQVFVGKRE